MLFILTSVLVSLSLTSAQVPIPSKPLGFVYNNASHSAAVHIDVFIDLACPDSKNAFPVMKQVADSYGGKTVKLKFLAFPLPYHRNAHIAAIGAQAVYNNPMSNASPDDSVLAWVKTLFDNQASWSDYSTQNDNLGQIKTLIASYSTKLGYSADDFKTKLSNSNYDWDARVEWKYGCSRGVAGTPWFFVNGVNIDADASWTVTRWKQVIDALLKGRTLMSYY